MLDQPLGLLDDHLGHLNMAARRFVEGGGNHFAAHHARHLGDFLGALVDQQDDQVALGIIAGNALGDVLQHQCLARLRRRHDQSALALADGRDQVDDARGDVLGAAVAALQGQSFLGVQRGQVFEQDLVLDRFRRVEVDLVDLEQGKVAFVVLRRADLAADGIAGAQVEAANLARRDIDVVGTGEIGTVSAAQKAETVLQDLQNPVAEDILALPGLGLEQAEYDVLLAHARGVIAAHFLEQIDKFGNGFFLEFAEVHRDWIERLVVDEKPGNGLTAIRKQPMGANRNRIEKTIPGNGLALENVQYGLGRCASIRSVAGEVACYARRD